MTIALYTTHKCGAIKSKSDLLLSFYLEFFYVTIYFPNLYSLLENCNKKEDYNKYF